jgi:hypothetical protein
VKLGGLTLTHLNILIIALKCAAITLVVGVLQVLPDQIAAFIPMEGVISARSLLTTIILPSLIKLLVASLFWFFPNKVINSIVPDSSACEVPVEYFKNFNIALISSIGVYLVAVAISDLVYFIALKQEISAQFSGVLPPEIKAGYLASIVQLVIGLALVFGHRGLVKLIAKLRR